MSCPAIATPTAHKIDRRDGRIRLVFEGTVRSARRCDMVERIVPGEEALSPSADGHALELALKPWEILTVRVSLSSG